MATESDNSAQAFGTDDQALRDLDNAIAIAEARKERLLRTAFRDGDLAPARFEQLSRRNGPDDALAIAHGRGSLPRSMWLGRLRGGIFDRKARHEAEKALEELPEAVRACEQLVNVRKDVKAARRKVFEEQERGRLEDGGRETGTERILDFIRGRKK